MINEHKEKWLRGELNDDYNNCRYASDKGAYARQWINSQDVKINLDNPQTIVDRICKYKIEDIENPDIPYIRLKSDWSDKIAAYDKLQELGLSNLSLPYEYKKYSETFDESILFELDKKPSNMDYIIKCNHGSGWNIVYKPRQTNHKLVVDKMNEWLQTNYAYVSGYEIQYKWIRPGYIVQPIMVYRPLDWSFWCENGKIEGIGLTKKLGKNYEQYIAFVSTDGKQNSWYIGGEPEQGNINKSQFEILKRMIPYVEKIAKPFKFVRCDMYCMNGKIYFGETTFTPCSGILDITQITKEP